MVCVQSPSSIKQCPSSALGSQAKASSAQSSVLDSQEVAKQAQAVSKPRAWLTSSPKQSQAVSKQCAWPTSSRQAVSSSAQAVCLVLKQSPSSLRQSAWQKAAAISMLGPPSILLEYCLTPTRAVPKQYSSSVLTIPLSPRGTAMLHPQNSGGQGGWDGIGPFCV